MRVLQTEQVSARFHAADDLLNFCIAAAVQQDLQQRGQLFFMQIVCSLSGSLRVQLPAGNVGAVP